MTRAAVGRPKAKTDRWGFLAVTSVIVCQPSRAGLNWVNAVVTRSDAKWPQRICFTEPFIQFDYIRFSHLLRYSPVFAEPDVRWLTEVHLWENHIEVS